MSENNDKDYTVLYYMLLNRDSLTCYQKLNLRWNAISVDFNASLVGLQL